ncbi:TPA: P22AR C-terminal domain-containing protein [Klebsiella pneumoniae]
MATSRHENGKTRQCANTNRVSIENYRKGNIDMNSVQNKELTFHNTSFAYMEMGGQVWLTAAEVGQALEYADDKAVQRIYSRHADEFTAQMTGVVKLTTPSGKQESRVFSLRGAHLVAMFARTPKAKEFRRWVLDILDREVAHSPIAKQFSDEELCSLSYLWRSSAVMYEACHNIYPLLLAAEHKLLPRFASIVTNHARTINRTRDLLRRETKHIEEHPWGDTNWKNVFSYGTGVLQ